jgi:quercetin dioxygenase-like cupin family protein
MAAPGAQGFLLPNGSRVVHGEGVNVRSAFPPELDIPGTLHIFSAGNAADPSTPVFKGAMGMFPFDTSCRMPRHVHMSTVPGEKRYIVEKVLAISGIGLTELAGQIYVVPPMTMVLIAPGVPHTWTACPAGVDLQALGVSDEKLVSDGKFLAAFEYEDATTFYPTKQLEVLKGLDDYVACDDLHAIRFPKMEAADVIEKAWFIWGKSARKLN